MLPPRIRTGVVFVTGSCSIETVPVRQDVDVSLAPVEPSARLCLPRERLFRTVAGFCKSAANMHTRVALAFGTA